MPKALKSILCFLAYTNIVVALAAGAFCEVTYLRLGVADHDVSWFVFFATIFMYGYAQWFEAPKTKHNNNSALTNWQIEHHYAHFLVWMLAGMGMVYFMFFLQKEVWIWLVVAGIISALYPLQSSRFKLGLRNIAGLKLMVIAAVWSLATYVIPAVQVGELYNVTFLSLALQRFLIVTALAIPFDIRDMRVDSPAMNTLPHGIGIKKSQLLAVACVFTSQLGAVIFYFNGVISITNMAAQLIVFECISFLVYRSTPKKPDLYFSAGIESLPVLLFLLSWVLAYFWP